MHCVYVEAELLANVMVLAPVHNEGIRYLN